MQGLFLPLLYYGDQHYKNRRTMSDRNSKVQGYVMSDVTKINFTFHLPEANNLRTIVTNGFDLIYHSHSFKRF